MKKSQLFLIIFSTLLTVNLIGITLKYFNLNRFIILAGFRFHINFVIPVIFIFYLTKFDEIKKIFIQSNGKKFYPFFVFTIIPISVLVGLLFLFNKVKIGKPEYLFELGFSSVIDFPIYLIWNFIQFLFLFSFLNFISKNLKRKFVPNFLILVFLFLYEVIPFYSKKFNYYLLVEFILFIILTAIIITKYKNFYMIFTVIFFVLWSDIILFGSSSPSLMQILFAKNFTNWSGFLKIDKQFTDYLSSLHYLVAIITTFLIKADAKDL